MTTTLDPRAARPLTSREISKVLCSIIGGIVTETPKAAEVVPFALAAVQSRAPGSAYRPLMGASGWFGGQLMQVGPSWVSALAATVAGFRGWCAPRDVDTALSWVAAHLHLVIPDGMEAAHHN